jgi:peptidoglycan hydrolase-like protein with peptidoglycan-binding domain
MARYSGATWRPLPENRTEPAITPTCVVLHTAVSNSSTLYPFFSRSDVDVESHFYVPASGSYDVEQYVDTGRQADAQFDGNAYAISIESWDHADPDHVAWSDWQLRQIARICAWAHTRHGIPLVRAYKDGSVIRGIGYHAQFYVWNKTNHSCPGPVRIKQVGEVIKRARAIVGAGGDGGTSSRTTKELQRLLNRWYAEDAGFAKLVVDGDYGAKTKAAVKDTQRYLNRTLPASLAVDGKWGTKTERKHKEYVMTLRDLERKIDKLTALVDNRTKIKVGAGLARSLGGYDEGDVVGIDQLVYRMGYVLGRVPHDVWREKIDIHPNNRASWVNGKNAQTALALAVDNRNVIVERLTDQPSG